MQLIVAEDCFSKQFTKNMESTEFCNKQIDKLNLGMRGVIGAMNLKTQSGPSSKPIQSVRQMLKGEKVYEVQIIFLSKHFNERHWSVCILGPSAKITQQNG